VRPRSGNPPAAHASVTNCSGALLLAISYSVVLYVAAILSRKGQFSAVFHRTACLAYPGEYMSPTTWLLLLIPYASLL